MAKSTTTATPDHVAPKEQEQRAAILALTIENKQLKKEIEELKTKLSEYEQGE